MTAKRNLFVRLVPCRCLRGEEEVVTALDYSHCSLEQVPKEIFTFEKTLEELYLDANQIEELPKQLFSCQMLHRLSLPDNDLTALPPAIANLINLKELDVSKNSIQEFPENIKNCKVLTIVEASVNPISKLPESFTQLLSLTQLYLNDAFLEFLPASFGRLTKLQILELRENQLKTLPKSMHKLSLLERLDLGSNEFTQVPEVLPQLTGIKELWVDGNRLTSLPGVIGALKQLTYLDVSKNNIEKVDEQISGCENLQDLLLSSNALSQLPASIGSLKKLTTLKVDENQLMYLPDSIGGLSVLEELDCSFNEMEALPSSIGQCVNLRTFAADHNFLTQLPPEIGSWKTVTVLFLHSNKLETLPEEMGDMDRLKVINLSDNRLRNLPFSFTKLSQLTAMWLSENQSKPLIPLQKEEDQETSKTMLTNYMFPQQTRTDDYIPVSDNESFNPSLWEEQRKQRAQVAFECDEDKDDREAPPREGNLKRYPTPYPEELKNMVKTAQSIAHRLKEEESSEESGKEAKLLDTVPVGLQNVGVKVIESTCANGETVESDPKSAMSKTESFSTPEPRESPDMQNSESTSLNTTNGTATNQDHALKESVDLSFGEEGMKMAEMLPPLLECSNSQPKVVTLNKERRDDSKDTDSLLDETAANSNHNNSNCSSPSRMSDSVSMTSESSQDASPCTPEKEAKTPITPQCRQEDENQNQLEDTASLLQNGNGSDASLQPVVKSQQDYGSRSEKTSEFDPATEEKLPLIDRGTDLRNGLGDPYSQWDQINMNVSQLPPDNGVQPDSLGETTNVYTPGDFQKGSMLNNNNNAPDHLLNGNKDQKQTFMEHINGHTDETPKFEVSHMATVHITASSEMPSSQTAEELSPQKKGTAAPMVKSQSVTSTEVDGMKIYNLDGGGGPNEASVTDAGVQGHGVIRSKSGSFVNDPSLQVYPGSSVVSSDLVPSSKTPVRYETSTGRVMVPANMPPPQYNVQYTSSAVPAENLWTQRTPVPPDQMYLPPHHSLANTNYSNRNNAPSYLLQPQQRAMPRPVDAWGKDRFLPPAPPRSSVQRQSSSSSTASMPDPRRIHLPDGGEYMTYWDIQAMGRGPPQMGPSGQRPLSARTYSMDGPSASRPQITRQHAHELPERTMSVSDFNYQRPSPRKWAAPRVKSEDSLLDAPAGGRVPVDWRDKVLQHIGTKMVEKVPYTNGQMCPRGRPQMPVARHPSREQLIDYMMQRVSQQHPGHPCPPHEHLQQEVRVKIEKNPELGFSISGGGRGNPFRPEDNGIFVTRVQPEGPASKFLQPGDKIVQANGYSFVNIDHGQAVSLLKTFPNTVELIIVREIPA